jgi:hypothetical protein
VTGSALVLNEDHNLIPIHFNSKFSRSLEIRFLVNQQ